MILFTNKFKNVIIYVRKAERLLPHVNFKEEKI